MLGRKKTQGKYDFVPEEYGEEEPWAENGAEDPEDYDPEDPGAGEPWGTEEDPEDYGDAPAEKPEKPEKHSIFRPETRKPNFVLSVAVNVVRVFALLAVLAGVAGLGAVLGIAKGYVETAPELDLAAFYGQAQTSFIRDCNNNLITEYKGTENRVMVSLAAMPKNLQNAYVAVEDARFYSHSGVDLKRIVGAFINNLTSSGTQGGSTITQQLIKNTLLSSEQSYKRKIQEAWLAMQLEMKYTKNQILESYLNTIYLGENYYGVQVAAEGYFGKNLGELTLRECAILAGVTNNPYYYNPRRNLYTRKSDTVDYAAITNNRTNYVLRCMYENQFITYTQYQAALNPDTAHVLEVSPVEADAMYPYAHYVEYAVGEVIDIFLEMNGLENTPANRAQMENRLRTGGYQVKLALDPQVQETVQDTLENWGKYPALRDPSDKIFRSRNSDGTYTEIIQPQAACAVLDYRTGELKAIVGSRTEVTTRKTLNRATDMRMPVGSSIKPIAVYAPALELGASPASVAYNMPLPIPGWKDAKGNDSWPTNYGGAGYLGPETLRTAMAKSHNTAAAYTLLTRVSVERSVDFLHRLGIDDAHIDATPFGLSLGSSGITPLQMTVAFGVLANGGVYQEPISVLGISDSQGNVVWDGHQHQERRRVFSDSTSWMIVDMLKTAVASGTGTSAKIKGQTVAGKTGTNSDQKGVFFAGMTGYYSSAIWVGHDNYKALSSKSTGSAAAAPLWQAYMSKIHAGLANQDILGGNPDNYGVRKVETCVVSGQLATDACRNDPMGYGTTTDYWTEASRPTVYCQMHTTETVCADTGMAASPWCPNPVARSVITIPTGHPLYPFLNTKYQEVLEQYLGPAAAYSGTVCTWHNAENQHTAVSATTAALISDARVLLENAENMMRGMDPYSAAYEAVRQAAATLESIISQESPTQSEVAAAMAMLTQAMAGIY
ncbi:MAG: transglycosylase domain-containing protein [Clostridiales bacterium]|nr:transglycosylase domain-containing protein [Clostridiales bacterium]